jgi:hypothetical protein
VLRGRQRIVIHEKRYSEEEICAFRYVSSIFIVDDEHVIAFTLAAGGREAGQMSDKTYLIRFKHPALGIRSVTAASAEIHGEHIAVLNSKAN